MARSSRTASPPPPLRKPDPAARLRNEPASPQPRDATQPLAGKPQRPAPPSAPAGKLLLPQPAVEAELAAKRKKLDHMHNEQKLKAVLLRTPPGRMAVMGLTDADLAKARSQKAALEVQAAKLEEEISALEERLKHSPSL
jgi:hypothetical protein